MAQFIPTTIQKTRATYNVLKSDKQYIKDMADKYGISEAEIGGQMLHAFIQEQIKLEKKAAKQLAKNADAENEVKAEEIETVMGEPVTEKMAVETVKNWPRIVIPPHEGTDEVDSLPDRAILRVYLQSVGKDPELVDVLAADVVKLAKARNDGVYNLAGYIEKMWKPKKVEE